MINSKFIKKIIILLILIEILICVMYYFGFVNLKKKNENISVLRNNLSSQIEKQQYMFSTQKMMKNTDSDITRVNNSLIQKDEDIKFIENIEGIARGNGLIIKIDNLAFEDDPSFSSNGLTILRIKASMSGNWAGMYSFLSQIETLPSKIRIDKFALTNNAGQISTDAEKPTAPGNDWQGVFEISVLKYK
jgi:Tfp pilus assembly protein PilO